ncbi:MAG: arylsulfatase [Bacteroidota bacterium]
MLSPFGLTITFGQGRIEKPNILLIMADDLGYGDLGSYNPESRIPTPNLDQLAKEGIRFTDAYCPVAVCSPSRYSLMTGRYSWRSWKKSGVMANYEPSMIEKGRLTLPKMLQQAGYTTAGFGKWHLGTTFPTTDNQKPRGYGKFRADDNGANLDFSKPVSDGPLDHGFDKWLGFSCASECWVFEDNKVMGAIIHDLYTIEAAPGSDKLQQIPLNNYLPFITGESIDFLQEYATKDKQPFFLYFAPYVPHIPLAVSPEFIGKTQAGVYGDYVHELDHYVGQLLNKLERLGLKENTLILFASDNGSQFVFTSPKTDKIKPSNNPDDVQIPKGSDVHRPNAPLRGTKWTAWEGGVRTPLIASWPNHFLQGKTSNQIIALNDFLQTLAALLDQTLPEDAGEDSHNLLPIFYGEKVKKGARETVVVQSSGNVLGLRWGKWKFIGEGNYQPANPNDPPGELYDLSIDLGEKENLYLKEPKMAVKMRKKLQEIMKTPSSRK